MTNAELASFTPKSDEDFEDEAKSDDYPEFIGEQSKEEEISFIDENMGESDNTDDSKIEEKEEVPTEQAKGGSPGTFIFIIILLVGIGGTGYYFKVLKPKKELESADDLDDFEFEEDDDFLGSDSFDDFDFSNSLDDNEQVEDIELEE